MVPSRCVHSGKEGESRTLEGHGSNLLILFSRQDSVFEAVKTVSNYPKSVIRQGRTDNWRDLEWTYASPSQCTIRPGTTNLCSAWYSRRHGVRVAKLEILNNASRSQALQQPTSSLPSPSASLNSKNGNGGLELLNRLRETNALIGALLSLVNPRLYYMQYAVLDQFWQGHAQAKSQVLADKVFQSWSSPFTGVAVISNRETILHRNTQGGKLLFDVVSAFGKYSHGRFEVPLLGRFSYNPGTTMVLPGYLLEHGAARTDGERICLASFMRPQVGCAALAGYEEETPPTVHELISEYGLSEPIRQQETNIWKQ